MKGIIAVSEKRDTVDKMKSFKSNFIKGLTEDELDRKIDVLKSVVTVAGVVATVTLFISPVEGFFGEILAGFATNFFVKKVEALREPLKTIMVKKENKINASIVDKYGNSKPISLSDNDMVRNVDTKRKNNPDVKGL